MGLMPLGTQPFEFPLNADKKETSVQDKILIQSHDDDMQITFFDTVVDRRVHTQSVKVKFFVVGYRMMNATVINYVGRWVELEPHQLDYLAPTDIVPYTYFLGFYPYVGSQNDLHLRFQLFPLPSNEQRGELYIEKLTVMDSDFNSSLSWLTDDTIPPIIPPVTGPIDPPTPIGLNPDPNNVWIW